MFRRVGGLVRYPQIPPAFEDAKKRLISEADWKGWEIVRVSDGYRNGRLVLEVLTKRDAKEVGGMLPAQFMGFPVVVTQSVKSHCCKG